MRRPAVSDSDRLERLLGEPQLEIAQLTFAAAQARRPAEWEHRRRHSRGYASRLSASTSERATGSRSRMLTIPHMRASRFAVKRIDLDRAPNGHHYSHDQGGRGTSNRANARLETNARNSYVTNWVAGAACRLGGGQPGRWEPQHSALKNTHQCCIEGRREALRAPEYFEFSIELIGRGPGSSEAYAYALSSYATWRSTIEAIISSRATYGSRCHGLL
jgi:hypothetical protein